MEARHGGAEFALPADRGEVGGGGGDGAKAPVEGDGAVDATEGGGAVEPGVVEVGGVEAAGWGVGGRGAGIRERKRKRRV